MTQPIALASLEAKDAIADALYRAVIGLDSNDRTLWESGWIKNEAVFDMNGNVMTGMDAINGNIFTHVGPLETTHMINNVRVDHKNGADQAYMTAYAIAQHYRPGEGMNPGTKGLLSGASYFIDVVKDSGDGLWKIKKWTMKLIWVDGDMSIVMPS